MSQLIIFQQGAPKSASSFCSQILREIVEQNGRTQKETWQILGKKHKGGFVERMAAIEKLFPTLPHYSVIKTHLQPFGAETLLHENRALAFITLRDPLDSVQSLLDHAENSRQLKKNEFSDVTTACEASRIILSHLSYSLLWLRNPNTYPVYYNDLRTRPDAVASMMAEKMELEVDTKKILKKFSNKQKIRRFNVGASGRGKKLLKSEDGEELRRMFSSFYNTSAWVNNSPAPKSPRPKPQ